MRQNEDYSPGDSISDSSEKLSQSGKGGRSVLYMTLVKGGMCSQAHIFAETGCWSRGADDAKNSASVHWCQIKSWRQSWGELEKKSFIAFPGKGVHGGLMPSKLCVPSWRG